MTTEPSGTMLKFIPIPDPFLIPERLVNLISEDDRDWPVSFFYRSGDLMKVQPGWVLVAFVDPDKSIRGFFWGRADFEAKKFFVIALAVDEEFRGIGLLGEVREYITRKILKTHALKGIMFSTTRPEIFERWGANRSQQVLMEVPAWAE
ncbi:MAG: hypothetical protein ABIJ57_10905 [Pseudomonadota bacterium]